MKMWNTRLCLSENPNNFNIFKMKMLNLLCLVYWPAIPVSTLDNLNSQEAYAIKTWSPEEINYFRDFVS